MSNLTASDKTMSNTSPRIAVEPARGQPAVLAERRGVEPRAAHGKASASWTGGIAHDFNNLLTVIQGNLQVLEDLPALTSDTGGE